MIETIFAVGELHQAREVILVVAARPRFGAVLAASVAATVVADHMEAAREIVFDERPRLSVVPASVNHVREVDRVRLLVEESGSGDPLVLRRPSLAKG